jgi:hypothetical protein
MEGTPLKKSMDLFFKPGDYREFEVVQEGEWNDA